MELEEQEGKSPTGNVLSGQVTNAARDRGPSAAGPGINRWQGVTMPRVYTFLLDHQGEIEDTRHGNPVTLGLSIQGPEFQVTKQASASGCDHARVR